MGRKEGGTEMTLGVKLYCQAVIFCANLVGKCVQMASISLKFGVPMFTLAATLTLLMKVGVPSGRIGL